MRFSMPFYPFIPRDVSFFGATIYAGFSFIPRCVSFLKSGLVIFSVTRPTKANPRGDISFVRFILRSPIECLCIIGGAAKFAFIRCSKNFCYPSMNAEIANLVTGPFKMLFSGLKWHCLRITQAGDLCP